MAGKWRRFRVDTIVWLATSFSWHDVNVVFHFAPGGVVSRMYEHVYPTIVAAMLER